MMHIAIDDNLLCWTARHVEALGRLWQARLELVVSGWDTALERAERRAKSGDRNGVDRQAIDADDEPVRRVERALLRASRFVPGATCIHRALAAQRMLLRRRLPARVVIGLRRGDDAIEGHAWVEIEARTRIVRLFASQAAGYSAVS